MTFNEEKILRLRAAYEKAVRDERTVFIFDGDKLLTTYAKYLLEYLEWKSSIEGDRT
jgi:hypothetical protein